MNTVNITSIEVLCRVVEDQFKDTPDTTVIYRGLADVEYKLCPKVGRFGPPNGEDNEPIKELLMLELFRRNSVGLTANTPENDWEFLAVAQHHGMATRLMDWTRSPLVAAYFAVAYPNTTYEPDERSREDGPVFVRREPNSVIYAWRCHKLDLSATPEGTPFGRDLGKIVRYIPRHITQRLKAQSGLFSFHPEPKEALSDPEIVTLEIPSDMRSPIKKSLNRLGIHEATMYPDLDGAARHIEWLQTNKRP